MSWTREGFESEYHHRRVRIAGYRTTILEGTVTAALWEEDSERKTVFAVMEDGYTSATPEKWTTFWLSPAELEPFLSNVSILP